MTITGEKLSNNATCIEPFKLRFLQKVKDLNFNPSQVYNADESGITILTCANAAGTHTLKMVVVGKSNKPRAFKNIDLPVHYYGQKSAWMAKDLFKKWLLLLDNAPGHPSEEELTTQDKCITAMFLPPNCTALIQHMDQHIIQFVKQDYKKNLPLKAVSKAQSIEKTLKKINMKDLVFALWQWWNA
ncbi:jerky protein homolog-like [Ctenocephalides felis]|uniref:jerky protein homolog-like n=1 Tax=Ctenocephalides felis TaxID=7515 RepID=UPI000E6E54D0|nr:jerky protein homolog-like [Ctenocephalides felis]